DDEQLRRSGSLRRNPVQARALQRRDPGLDAGARRRRRCRRQDRHRQEDPQCEAKADEAMTWRASIALAAAIATGFCAAPILKLPSTSGAAASDGRDALAQALTACRGIRTLTAEVAVGGKV